MKLRSVIALISILLAGAACSYLPGSGPRVYRGWYTATGSELSGFQPCGTHEVWSAAVSPEVKKVLYARVPPPEHFAESYGDNRHYWVYVEWRGELSGKGHYGHTVGLERQLTVTEAAQVVDVRAAAPEGCR